MNLAALRRLTRDAASDEPRVPAGTKTSGTIHAGEWTSKGGGGGSKAAPTKVTSSQVEKALASIERGMAAKRAAPSPKGFVIHPSLATSSQLERLKSIVSSANAKSSSVEASSSNAPSEWNDLNGDVQDAVRAHWMENTFEEYLQYERDNWNESAGPDNAKAIVRDTLNDDPDSEDNDWARDAIAAYLEGSSVSGPKDNTYEKEGRDAPFTAEQLFQALHVDYEEGVGDLAFTFDKATLNATRSNDPQFSGFASKDYSTLLTDDMRNGLTDALEEAFNKRVEDVAVGQGTPDDMLAGQAHETQEEAWEGMDSTEKFQYAKENEIVDTTSSDARVMTKMANARNAEAYSEFTPTEEKGVAKEITPDFTKLVARLKEDKLHQHAEPGSPENAEWEAMVEQERAFQGLQAAVRDPTTGKIYTGRFHQQAWQKLSDEGRAAIYKESEKSHSGELQGEHFGLNWEGPNIGFVLPGGKFIPRTEMEKILAPLSAVIQTNAGLGKSNPASETVRQAQESLRNQMAYHSTVAQFHGDRAMTRDEEARVPKGTQTHGTIHGGEFTARGGGKETDPSKIVAPLRKSVKKWRGQTSKYAFQTSLFSRNDEFAEKLRTVLKGSGEKAVVGEAVAEAPKVDLLNVPIKPREAKWSSSLSSMKSYLGSRGAIGVVKDACKSVANESGELVLEGTHIAVIQTLHELFIHHLEELALAAIGGAATAMGGPYVGAVAMAIAGGVVFSAVHHLAEKIGFSPHNTQRLLVACVRGLKRNFRLIHLLDADPGFQNINLAFDGVERSISSLDMKHRPTHDADFDESKHPRGQPTNAGEFAKVSVHAPGQNVHVSHVTIKRNVEEANAPVQLSWESTPGHTNTNMAGIHEAPIEQRREYHNAIQKVMLDDKGNDVIAQAFGLDTRSSFDAPGIFQGRLNPGSQSIVKTYGQARPLTDDEKARLNASEAVRGALLRQDAAAWHHPQFFESPIDATKPYLIPVLTWRGKQYRGVTHQAAFQSMPKEVQQDFLKSQGNQLREPYGYIAPGGLLLNRSSGRKYAEQNGLLKPTAFNQPLLIAEDLNDKAMPSPQIAPEHANMVDFRIGRPLTDDEALAATRALSSLGGGFYSPVGTEQGFRLLNVPEITGLDNQAFMNHVVAALDGHPDLPDMRAYPVRAETGYLENDWKAHPHGEDYRSAIAALNRPDLVGTADALFAKLGPRIAAVEDVYGLKYGWRPDKETRFWSNASGAEKVVQATPGQTLHIGDSRYSARASASVLDRLSTIALRSGPQHRGVREHLGRHACP